MQAAGTKCPVADTTQPYEMAKKVKPVATKAKAKASPKKSRKTTTKKATPRKAATPKKKAPTPRRKKNLARPSKGRDLSEKQKIELAKAITALYATNEYSLLECLKANGVKSWATWYSWVNKIKEIEVLYKHAQVQAQSLYDHKLVYRGKTSLEKLVEGYEYQEERTETDAQGNVIRKVVITKFKGPQLGAAKYALNNKDKLNFTEHPKPDPGDNAPQLPPTSFNFFEGGKPVKE